MVFTHSAHSTRIPVRGYYELRASTVIDARLIEIEQVRIDVAIRRCCRKSCRIRRVLDVDVHDAKFSPNRIYVRARIVVDLNCADRPGGRSAVVSDCKGICFKWSAIAHCDTYSATLVLSA